VSSFKVSTEDLRALAGQLSGLVAELGQAGEMTIDGASAGEPRVEASIDSFFSDWSEGLSKIQTTLSEVMSRLSGASDDYDQADQSIAGAFGPG